MKVSLILSLVLRETLTQMFIDSVIFIAHTYDIKNKQIYQYLLLKEAVKLHQLSNLFEVNFEV